MSRMLPCHVCSNWFGEVKSVAAPDFWIDLIVVFKKASSRLLQHVENLKKMWEKLDMSTYSERASMDCIRYENWAYKIWSEHW